MAGKNSRHMEGSMVEPTMQDFENPYVLQLIEAISVLTDVEEKYWEDQWLINELEEERSLAEAFIRSCSSSHN
jgi:hypothetical protein